MRLRNTQLIYQMSLSTTEIKMTATINTVNPFITHHNCHILGFWFENADGENQVIYPQYLHAEQKVVCKVDGEDTTFTMFSTVEYDTKRDR
jgi:hypothetical protein